MRYDFAVTILNEKGTPVAHEKQARFTGEAQPCDTTTESDFPSRHFTAVITRWQLECPVIQELCHDGLLLLEDALRQKTPVRLHIDINGRRATAEAQVESFSYHGKCGRAPHASCVFSGVGEPTFDAGDILQMWRR